ncbi:MAG: hypothetical protein K8R34_07810, partial [Methanosarcinales archaeon]|nr:hypothetical protein [Methanosarcinales archaeon]
NGPKTVTVEFELIPGTQYDLTASVTGGNGTVSPTSGTYDEGTVVTLTATPDAGYRVYAWTGTDDDALTENNNTVTMNGPKTVTVEFELIPGTQYDLTASVTGGNGTVSPTSGTYDEGTVVTLTATPDAGYRVYAWTGTDDDALTENNNTVTMNGPKTVTVEFELIPGTQYALTMAVSGNGSTIPSVGDHNYAEGEVITISAVPDSGWQFDIWNGDVADPNLATTTVNMDTDKTVTATFTESGVIYTEDFEDYPAGADPVDWLDTAADNSMLEDDSLFKIFDLSGNKVFGTTSILANIHSHYIGAVIDTLSSYEYTGRMRMTTAGSGIGVTFFSEYPQADAYYRLRRHMDNSFHIAPHGTSITGGTTDTGVVPLSNVWYRFRIQVEDTGTRTEIRARVWQDGTSEPSVWQADAYDDSATRLISGTIGVWSFTSGSKYWDDLTVNSGSPPATQHDLTAGVTGGNGTVSPTSGTYDEGTVVTLTATPDAGYRVYAWTGTDDDALTETTNTVTMDGPKTVTVEFELIPGTQYDLTASVTGGNGTVSPTSGTYDEGTVVTLTATPDAGYRVYAWTGTDDDALTETTNTVTMDGPKTVTVEFELIPGTQYDLTASVTGGNGTVSPTSGTYDEGTVVTLTATPDAGYRVYAWTGTDDDALTDTTNTVTMNGPKTVTVEFELIPGTQY